MATDTKAPESDRLSLAEIGQQTGTDKFQKHRYDCWYEFHFGQLQNEKIRLLEIGVKRGASLRMWERFFPQATIYGIDIHPKCSRYGTERSRIFIGDQANPIFLQSVAEEIGKPFDIIIDDGGHSMQQQRTSLLTLFRYLKPRGYYVVEDIHTSYREKHNGGPPGKKNTFMAMLKELVDAVHLTGKEGVKYQPLLPIAELHVYPRICFLRRRKRDDKLWI